MIKTLFTYVTIWVSCMKREEEPSKIMLKHLKYMSEVAISKDIACADVFLQAKCIKKAKASKKIFKKQMPFSKYSRKKINDTDNAI